MKKLVCLILALAMVLSLVACAKTEDKTPQTDGPDAGSEMGGTGDGKDGGRSESGNVAVPGDDKVYICLLYTSSVHPRPGTFHIPGGYRLRNRQSEDHPGRR